MSRGRPTGGEALEAQLQRPQLIDAIRVALGHPGWNPTGRPVEEAMVRVARTLAFIDPPRWAKVIERKLARTEEGAYRVANSLDLLTTEGEKDPAVKRGPAPDPRDDPNWEDPTTVRLRRERAERLVAPDPTPETIASRKADIEALRAQIGRPMPAVTAGEVAP